MPTPQIAPAKLPHATELPAVLRYKDAARFFEEFSNFAAYFFSRPLDKWPPLFRMYHVLSTLDISVNIEDLAGFFDDHEDRVGAYAHETEAFLREIGASRAAHLLADANGLFPGGQVPKDHKKRDRLTERMRDREPEPFEEIRKKHDGAMKTMSVLLQKYLRAHERELLAELETVIAQSHKQKPKWRTLDAACALETPADRIAGGAPKEHAALYAVWERISARGIMTSGFEGLTRGERLFYVLWFVMDSDITNGGLHQFFANSSGDFAEAAKRGLKEIGARKVLTVLEKASALFPRGVVPADRDARSEVLERQEEREGEQMWTWWDALSREYDQAAHELHARLLEWVRDHREEFPDPDGGRGTRKNANDRRRNEKR